MILTTEKILGIISNDQWMINTLRAVRNLDLPDSWIGAGFVRNKIWDYLHGYAQRTPLNDIDVIYFDQAHPNEEHELSYQLYLNSLHSSPHWSITNQARMHHHHNDNPYTSSEQAISRWPETPTCIAVTLDQQEHLHLLAPHGIEDLVNLIVRPVSSEPKVLATYRERMREKNWKNLWPKLKIY